MVDLVKRLKDACVGHPHAEVAWPHRLLHEAIEEIERLRQSSPSIHSEAKANRAESEMWIMRKEVAKLRAAIAAWYEAMGEEISAPPEPMHRMADGSLKPVREIIGDPRDSVSVSLGSDSAPMPEGGCRLDEKSDSATGEGDG